MVQNKTGKSEGSDVGFSVRGGDMTRGTGGSTEENSTAVPKKSGEADGCGLLMKFDDEFTKHARKLSSTSLPEIINQVREHKRVYDNDRSEDMGNKAILLLMQYWATRMIMVMSKKRNLPEHNYWNIVFEDGQAYQ